MVDRDRWLAPGSEKPQVPRWHTFPFFPPHLSHHGVLLLYTCPPRCHHSVLGTNPSVCQASSPPPACTPNPWLFEARSLHWPRLSATSQVLGLQVDTTTPSRQFFSLLPLPPSPVQTPPACCLRLSPVLCGHASFLQSPPASAAIARKDFFQDVGHLVFLLTPLGLSIVLK